MQDGYHLGKHRGSPCAVLYVGGERQNRITLGKSSPEDAERRLRALNAEFFAKGKSDDYTVKRIFEDYIADRERAKKAAVFRMKQCRDILLPHFGALYATEITKARCEAYIEHRRNLAVGDSTIRTELTYLAVALKFAVDMELIPARPRIWRPPQARPRSQQIDDYHLSRSEVSILLVEAREQWPHLWLWMKVALATAGRPLHILQLEWERVDFHKRFINLDDPKRDRTTKGRARVPMNQEVMDALLEAKRHAGSSGYVIEFNGKPIKSIKKGLRELCKRTGIKASPYVFRHTAAVWMAEAGIPMEEIAQYMGHTNPLITYKTYARFSPTHLQRAAKALQVVRGSDGTDVPAKRNTARTDALGGHSA